jgi:hypothetical protein
MASESIGRFSPRPPAIPLRSWLGGRTAAAWIIPTILIVVTLAASIVWSARVVARPAAPPAGPSRTQPAPTIRTAELRYATRPAPGVWAELKIVLDNPIAAAAEKCALLVPGTLLEDFQIRSTEPKLLSPPRRRPDGRYALIFPAPISESWNWYRLDLKARRDSHRPLEVGFLLEGAADVPETAPVRAQVLYADRLADPFMVVPEPLVRWVPGRAGGAFPVLLVFTVALAATVLAGCLAAFRLVRR